MQRKTDPNDREQKEIEDLEQEERSERAQQQEIIESHMEIGDSEDYPVPERHRTFPRAG